jgi:hypothetical protein
MKEVNAFDLKEEQVQKIISLGVKSPKTFSFASQEELLTAAETLTADQEGYVVKDSEFRRVKVKSPLYLKMHYLKANNELTPKHFVEMIQANETEEFLSAFPEYNERVEQIRGRIQSYITTLQKDWKSLYSFFGPNFTSRKEFAGVAKETTNSAAMFKTLDEYIRGNKDTEKFITKYVMEMMSEKLVSAIGA